jgi:hypothetical protein
MIAIHSLSRLRVNRSRTKLIVSPTLCVRITVNCLFDFISMTLPRATAVIEGETCYVVISTYDTVTTDPPLPR